MRKGYSLLVVLIALSIFAVGLLSIMAILPSGNQAVARAVFYNRAASIAEREFSSIRAAYSDQESPTPPEHLSGEEPDGPRWTAEIGEESGKYRVRLDVFRRENGKEEKESFETVFVRK